MGGIPPGRYLLHVLHYQAENNVRQVHLVQLADDIFPNIVRKSIRPEKKKILQLDKFSGPEIGPLCASQVL